MRRYFYVQRFLIFEKVFLCLKVSPAWPIYQNSITINMTLEHLRSAAKLQNYLFKCHFVHHVSYMDWISIENWPLNWKADDHFLKQDTTLDTQKNSLLLFCMYHGEQSSPALSREWLSLNFLKHIAIKTFCDSQSRAIFEYNEACSLGSNLWHMDNLVSTHH